MYRRLSDGWRPPDSTRMHGAHAARNRIFRLHFRDSRIQLPMAYALTWELDSILPQPSTAEFRTVLDGYRDQLNALADTSDRLPGVNSDQGDVAKWVKFLRAFEE